MPTDLIIRFPGAVSPFDADEAGRQLDRNVFFVANNPHRYFRRQRRWAEDTIPLPVQLDGSFSYAVVVEHDVTWLNSEARGLHVGEDPKNDDLSSFDWF